MMFIVFDLVNQVKGVRSSTEAGSRVQIARGLLLQYQSYIYIFAGNEWCPVNADNSSLQPHIYYHILIWI